MKKPRLPCDSCLGGLAENCPVRVLVDSQDYYVAWNHESPFPMNLVERFVDEEGCKMYSALLESDAERLL